MTQRPGGSDASRATALGSPPRDEDDLDDDPHDELHDALAKLERDDEDEHQDDREAPPARNRVTTSAVYYRDAKGHEPVDAWIEKLPGKAALKVDDATDLLNGLPDDAPPLGFPWSSQIAGPLRELRCHYGRRLIRILYQRSDNLFVLLHAIDKATTKVPPADIKIAQDRMTEFQARMDATPRRGIRAAGHDAPSAARAAEERFLD